VPLTDASGQRHFRLVIHGDGLETLGMDATKPTKPTKPTNAALGQPPELTTIVSAEQSVPRQER
jgi:hypothetical protein